MTVRIDEAEKALISSYAKLFGTSASEFMRRCAPDHIEDEFDVKAWHVAKAEHEANPVSYTLDEVEKTLSL